MRNILSLLFSFIIYTATAQPAGYTKVADVAQLKVSLANANAKVQDIKSEFKQVKNLSLLEDKITSNGKFYYKKDLKVRIEYTAPYSYLMVMNGTKMMVKDEQKTNTINTGNSKLMQSVNRVMIDCMKGTVFTNPDFSVTPYQNSKNYLLVMKPTTVEMKKLFEKVDVYLDKTNMNVVQLVMTENGGDYTNMNFFNIKQNTTLNETLFKVK